MNKEEVISLMINSINADNREFCKTAMMSPDEIEFQISQSQPALYVMLSNIYDKLVNAELIRSS